jgi:hypothetical protein
VDDSFFDESHKTVADLAEDVDRLLLGECGVLLNESFEVAVADLLDDVVVMAALHDIQHLNDVLTFHQLQNLNL